jgi:purine-cytosine permease-like protein
MIRFLARNWDYVAITLIVAYLFVHSYRTGHHQDLIGYAVGWPSALLLMYTLNRMTEKERERNH